MDERNDYASLTKLDPLPFTDQQLIKMAEMHFPFNEVWREAFDYYNERNEPLSMGCKSCYGKVIAYILSIRLSA